jgi:hypothetical protein
MDERLWTIEALVLRYCTSVEDHFQKEVNSTLQIHPMLVVAAIKSIIEAQGMNTVRVSYAKIKANSKLIGYRFWINYKLPRSTRWINLQTSIAEYR